MKIIKPIFHGILDYLTVTFLFISPAIMNLSISATNLCYIFGGMQLMLSIATNYQLGLIRAVPFRMHGKIDFVIGILLFITAVTYINVNLQERNLFIVLGVIYMVVLLLTDFGRSKKCDV